MNKERNAVGEFEKVSFGQFHDAIMELSESLGGQPEKPLRAMYDSLSLPLRATKGSVGYDIKSPFGFSLEPGESIKIPTGIRVRIDDGWWLGCLPRSGLGFKYRLQLANTMGVIDGDYYNSDNEGHIFLKMTNDSREDKTFVIKAGESIAQAIFLPYGITYSDDADGVRNGGMGSTGK